MAMLVEDLEVLQNSWVVEIDSKVEIAIVH